MKGKINELETKSKNKNIRDFYRGFSKFKKGYKPRINIVRDETSDLVAYSHRTLNRGRVISLFLNVRRFNDVKQTEIHTAELLVPEPSAFEAEMAI